MQTFRIKTHNRILISVISSLILPLSFLAFLLLRKPYGDYIFITSPLIVLVTINLLYFLTSSTTTILLGDDKINIARNKSSKNIEISFENVKHYEYGMGKFADTFLIENKNGEKVIIYSGSILFLKNGYIEFISAFLKKINRYNSNQEDQSKHIIRKPFSFLKEVILPLTFVFFYIVINFLLIYILYKIFT